MIDGRTLPRHTRGVLAPANWGMMGLILIEGMVFLSLIASWFYLRFHNPRWPPPGIEPPDLWLPGLRTLLLVLAAGLTLHTARRSMQLPPGRLALQMAGASVPVAAYLLWQGMDLAQTSHHWTEHAYSSLYWTLSGYAGLHALTLLGLQLTVAGFTRTGRLAGNTPLAQELAALYGSFVAVTGVLSWLTLHLAPHVL